MAIVIKNPKGIKPPPAIVPIPSAGKPMGPPIPAEQDEPVSQVSPSKKLMMSGAQGKMHEEVIKKDGAVFQTDTPIPVPPVEGPQAMVTVSMGSTRNLGNYESVKFSVSISLPCAPTAEDIDATFHEARGWVDTRVALLNEEISKELG